MNYKIITDEKLLLDFIDWLPELETNECYYLCLFARSKYAKNEDGSNQFPHIRSDKSQLKRFICSRKEFMLNKIKQIEVAFGAYKTKTGADIPQEALTLYITPNPRHQKKAMHTVMKRFIDIQECNGENFNIHAEALSAIQKSCRRKVFVDFDFDDIDYSDVKEYIESKINRSALHVLNTRGGFHLLVETSKIEEKHKKSWYQAIAGHEGVDIKGDQMIPVPGTYQGGFTPFFIVEKEEE